MTPLRRRVWRALTYVPWTPPWRLYRETDRWIREAVAMIRTHEERAGEPFPEFPLPVPRDQGAIRRSIKALMPILRALQALDDGNVDLALALMAEHDVEPRRPSIFDAPV